MKLCTCHGKDKGGCLALTVTLSAVYLGSLWMSYPYAETGMFALLALMLGIPLAVLWIVVFSCNKRLR